MQQQQQHEQPQTQHVALPAVPMQVPVASPPSFAPPMTPRAPAPLAPPATQNTQIASVPIASPGTSQAQQQLPVGGFAPRGALAISMVAGTATGAPSRSSVPKEPSFPPPGKRKKLASLGTTVASKPSHGATPPLQKTNNMFKKRRTSGPVPDPGSTPGAASSSGNAGSASAAAAADAAPATGHTDGADGAAPAAAGSAGEEGPIDFEAMAKFHNKDTAKRDALHGETGADDHASSRGDSVHTPSYDNDGGADDGDYHPDGELSTYSDREYQARPVSPYRSPASARSAGSHHSPRKRSRTRDQRDSNRRSDRGGGNRDRRHRDDSRNSRGKGKDTGNKRDGPRGKHHDGSGGGDFTRDRDRSRRGGGGGRKDGGGGGGACGQAA